MPNTIIQLKNSGQTGNVPATLQPGELAINYTDGKLFYGNVTNSAVEFVTEAQPSGLNGEIQFNDLGNFGATANLTFDKATNTLTTVEIVSATTNRIYDQANSAFHHSNSSFNHANSAFDAANSAASLAQNVYDVANTKLDTSGGTISGSLTISGNLSVLGNVVTYSAQELIVSDPIVLYANNNTGNTVDIGFVGHYSNDAGANVLHLGLINHAATDTFYLFKNYLPHVQETNSLDINDSSFQVANLTANLITNVISVRGFDPLDRANSAFDRANGAVSNSGGSISGTLITDSFSSNSIITINTNQVLRSNTVTSSSASETVFDSWSASTYRSAKYFVQATNDSQYHVIELSLVHNGTDVFLTQYGEIKTGSTLATFDASISGGIVSVKFTPTNAITTVKVAATLIPI